MENFTMKDVMEVLERDFTSDTFKKAKELLEERGKGLMENEKIRLWMAIIKLSGKDFNKFRFWIAESENNSQNVLFWGE
jgi:uncharacterized protein YbaP (TraB family)